MARIINPPEYNHVYLYLLGVAFMVLNKVRHRIMGYKTPRTFSTTEIERSVDYCINVVNQHELQLQKYTGTNNPFNRKKILEIGPGPDLGTGFCMIAKGALRYTALDKNKLVSQTPDIFYEVLLEKLKGFPNYVNAINAFKTFKRKTNNSIVKYIYDPEFKFKKIQDGSYDMLVTQAVLEHIDNIKCTFQKIKNKITPNGVLSNLVDASTHTRYIRDIDHCNLLRYSDFIYNMLKFDGSPNRLRTSQYEKIFKELDYKNINIVPNKIADSVYVNKLKAHISPKFKDDDTLHILSFYLLAST
jgi:hypothetical protein